SRLSLDGPARRKGTGKGVSPLPWLGETWPQGSPGCADQCASGDDEQARDEGAAADHLAAPEDEGRQDDTPQRLRCIQRREERHRALREALDQARVGAAERDARGGEDPERRAERPP